MKTVRFGRTNLDVSRLSMGGLFVAGFASEREEAIRTIRRALDLGIRTIDTAPNYADSEIVIGEALGGMAPEAVASLVLSTKVGEGREGFDPRSPVCIRESVERSLLRLGRSRIDLLFIHEPDRPDTYDWWDGPEDFRGPVLDTLRDLKRQGLVGAIGLAGTTPYRLARIMRTGDFDAVLTAFNYCPLYREAVHEIFPVARSLDMGVMAGSPLRQGYFATRRDDLLRSEPPWMPPPRRHQFLALYRLLDEIGMEIADFSMRFMLSHPDIHTIVTGSRDVRELERNIASVERGPLPPDVLARLDEIYRMVPFPPQEEPFIMPFGGIYERRKV